MTLPYENATSGERAPMSQVPETGPLLECEADDLRLTLALYKANYQTLAERHGTLLADHDRLKRAARDFRRVAHKARRVKCAEYASVRRELAEALDEKPLLAAPEAGQ